MKPSAIIKILRPGASVAKGTEGSAGIDLGFYPSEANDKPVTILPGRSALLETGIGVDMIQNDDYGVCGQLWPRSGLSLNAKLETGAGLIDPDYKGEIMVHVYNHGALAQTIKQGERFAQLVLVMFLKPQFVQVVCGFSSEKERYSPDQAPRLSERFENQFNRKDEGQQIESVYKRRGAMGFGSTGLGGRDA